MKYSFLIATILLSGLVFPASAEVAIKKKAIKLDSQKSKEYIKWQKKYEKWIKNQQNSIKPNQYKKSL